MIKQNRITAILTAVCVAAASFFSPVLTAAASSAETDTSSQDGADNVSEEDAYADEEARMYRDMLISDDEEESEDAGDSGEESAPESSQDESATQTVYETVTIDSMEDFEAFVENCHVDSWSADKHVVLNVDLDFDGEEFEPVEIFSGLFDGQGHTLSGISITGYIDETGVFGMLAQGGVVANLNVEGSIEPTGYQDILGGIVGNNYGTISNCSFSGYLNADSEVGGIAAYNASSGIIIGCCTEGSILANSGVGGIVGYNEGTVSSCDNGMEINTAYQDTTTSLDEISETLDTILQNGSLLNTGELSEDSDIGGVAGFSSGVITSCTNRGTVGYEHVGYNVGGIVGRSSGYVSGCTNYAQVYGRKDVGGIVGQMQPYLNIDFDEETLSDLEAELDTLGDMVQDLLDDMEGHSGTLSNHLTNIDGLVDIAIDSVAGIADDVEDTVDDASAQLNDAGDKIRTALNIFSSVGSSLDDYMDDVLGAFDDVGSSVSSYLNGIASSVESLVDDLKEVLPEDTTIEESDDSDDSADDDGSDDDGTGDGGGDVEGDGTDDSGSGGTEDDSDGDNEEEDSNTGGTDEDSANSDGDSAVSYGVVGDSTPGGAPGGTTDAGTAVGKSGLLSTLRSLADAAGAGRAAAGEIGVVSRTEVASTVITGTMLATWEPIPESTDTSESDLSTASETVVEGSGDDADRDSSSGNGSSSGDETGSGSGSTSGTENVSDSGSTSEGGTDSGSGTGEGDGTGTGSDTTAGEGDGSGNAATSGDGTTSGSGSENDSAGSGDTSQTVSGDENASEVSSASLETSVTDTQALEAQITSLEDQVEAASLITEYLSQYSEEIAELQAKIEELYESADLDSLTELLESVDLSALLSEMQEGIEEVADVIASIESILGSVSFSAFDISGLSSSISDALDVLEDSPDVMSSISTALDVLATIDLQLDGVSESTRTNGDILYSSLSQLMDEMEYLNQDVSDSFSVTKNDISAISNQFDRVLDVLIDTVVDITEDADADGEDRIEDISDTDDTVYYRGYTADCENYGDVDADIDVGGIVGMIDVEYSLDPELDVETSGSATLDYIFQAKCTVDNCTNRGGITTRSNYAGGIAGRMEMGVVKYSANYGTLDCSGNYIGGIVGYSAGTVRSNTAKCDISGDRYVGGIAGYATKLLYNLAMVNVLEYEQYVGAIAGSAAEVNESDIYANYYYSLSLYGIDGVSYTGLAEGISYAGLQAQDDLPDSFNDLVLTFVVDDEVIGVITCAYGESVPESDIPEIPAAEGFYGVWSRTDYSSIVMDETITAEYVRYVTLLTSDQTRADGLCAIEVDGQFRAEDSLTVTQETAKGLELERWTIVIPDDGQESHQVRYLMPDGESDAVVHVYLIADGRKKEIETSTFSNYITFDVEGSEVTFSVDNTLSSSGQRKVFLIVGGAALIIAVILILCLSRRRRRKRAAARAQWDADDETSGNQNGPG